MTEQEARAEINRLQAENTAMVVKANIAGFAGSLAGMYIARKRSAGIWGHIGGFLLGGTAGRLSLAMVYANKLAANAAMIQNLQAMLPQQLSLTEQLQQKIDNE